MARDWHATYLTDQRAMDAVRDRAVRHGDDGWAAAYTIALTLPAAPGSHAATGARDVLVPDTLPDTSELARLANATPEDPLAAGTHGGYYGEPNIAHDNHDMAPSMVCRVRPDEVVRPDLRCPPCCVSVGEPEEVGMPGQVYRCTECGQLWESVSTGGSDCCGHCVECLMRRQMELMAATRARGTGFEQRQRLVDFLRGVTVFTMGPEGRVDVAPLVVPPTSPWSWQADPERAHEIRGGSSTLWAFDEVAPLIDAQWLDNARMIADAFELPEHVVLGETDEEYQDRVEAEAEQLAVLLDDVSRGLVTTELIDTYPSAQEARRRRLVVTGGAERGHDRRWARRMQLTALGNVTYRALRGRPRRGSSNVR